MGHRRCSIARSWWWKDIASHSSSLLLCGRTRDICQRRSLQRDSDREERRGREGEENLSELKSSPREDLQSYIYRLYRSCMPGSEPLAQELAAGVYEDQTVGGPGTHRFPSLCQLIFVSNECTNDRSKRHPWRCSRTSSNWWPVFVWERRPWRASKMTQG